MQLGYPNLQVDNGFSLTDGTGTYDAGNQVRALVTEGNAAFAALAPAANGAHPGQATFLTGVPEKFAGHEPDALVGNPARWINQVGNGCAATSGITPTASATRRTPTCSPPGHLRHPRRPGSGHGEADGAAIRLPASSAGQRVRLRIKVTLSDGSRPRGTLVVRGLPGHRKLATTKPRKKDHGSCG